jgi:hypothetical protein
VRERCAFLISISAPSRSRLLEHQTTNLRVGPSNRSGRASNINDLRGNQIGPSAQKIGLGRAGADCEPVQRPCRCPVSGSGGPGKKARARTAPAAHGLLGSREERRPSSHQCHSPIKYWLRTMTRPRRRRCTDGGCGGMSGGKTGGRPSGRSGGGLGAGAGRGSTSRRTRVAWRAASA